MEKRISQYTDDTLIIVINECSVHRMSYLVDLCCQGSSINKNLSKGLDLGPWSQQQEVNFFDIE